MQNIVYSIFVILIFSCAQNSSKIPNSVSIENPVTTPLIPTTKKYIKRLSELKLPSDLTKSYSEVKNSVEQSRLQLNRIEASIDSLSITFKRSLLNRIIPFWEGTMWSFEGHTATPKTETIACGYFVSTTLKHIGLNINRYQLAQQAPIDETNSLALNTKVITIAGNTADDCIFQIDRALKEGIHFIGFDASHVGYILKEKSQLYLIHSNYIGAKGVEIETIESSEVFASYSTFHIAELSTNSFLLKHWKKGTKIEILHK